MGVINLNQQELEKLGRDIAHKCEWVGEHIFVVLQSALEDANFHKERAVLTKVWEAIQ